MIPHFCAEMWEHLGIPGSVEQAPWPQFDAKAAAEEQLTIVVQVRGKVRGRLEVPADIEDDELIRLALADDNVVKFIAGDTVKKTIVVKKKLVNIVV
jgi:leucyl-tRNA synthetase